MKTKLLKRLRRKANNKYSIVSEFNDGWDYITYYFIKRYDFLFLFSTRVAGYYTSQEPLEPVLEELRQEEFERIVLDYKKKHEKVKRNNDNRKTNCNMTEKEAIEILHKHAFEDEACSPAEDLETAATMATDALNKNILNTKKKNKIYCTITKAKFDNSTLTSYEIYFLPMLRYLRHGKLDGGMIQFRWLAWGINWKINRKSKNGEN